MKNTIQLDTIPEVFLGIDVGKADLFCHLLARSASYSAQFPNSSMGIKNAHRLA